MAGYDILDAAYRALLPAVSALDDDASWRPSRCSGWAVRDLVFHLLGDAQRALVALHTPALGPADVDAVSYWRNWQPEPPGEDLGRRATRISASVWTRMDPLARQYAETARAVLVAARERPGRDLVATQGQVISVTDLLSTVAVEVTVHQLDMGLGEPSRPGLAEARRVLDGLLGRPAPFTDEVRYVLVATGREPPDGEETALLGADASRLPLFG